MSQHDLDRLIHAARGAETPSSVQRAQVREGLVQRIARGDALPDLDEASLSPPPARSWLGGTGAVPVGLGGLAVAALVVAGLVGYGLGRDAPRQAPGTGAARASTPSDPALPFDSASADGLPSSTNARLPGDDRTTSASTMTIDSIASRGASEGTAANHSGANSAANRPTANASASSAPARVGTGAVARNTARALAPSEGRASPVDHEAERRALARVQHALRDGRFVEAVAGLDRDDRAFASGALVEERAAARVLARCGSGDAAEAQRLATAFVARYPGSPLRSRVLASCPAPGKRRSP
jgi:hypothetical protein